MNKRLIIAAITLEGLLAGLTVMTLVQGKTFGAFYIAILLQWPSSALFSLIDGGDTVRGIAACCLAFVIQTCLIWCVLRGLSSLFAKKEVRDEGWPRLIYAPWPSAQSGEKVPNQPPEPMPLKRHGSS